MPKCPNCGQETQRTEDWACQWCGYPLHSPAYKKIDKTWREIKEEGGATFDFRRPAVPSEPAEDISQAVPEIKVEPKPKPAPMVKPLRKPVPEPAPPPQPEPVARVEQPFIEPEAKPVEPVPPAQAEVIPPAQAAMPSPAPPVEPEPVTRPTPAPEPRPVPVAETAIALTVDELLSAYMLNDVAAHEKFNNRLLRVTGLVGKVMVNETRALYTVLLSSPDIAGFRDVECRFMRQYASLINKLKPGQSITVQGRYFGYVINVILRECVLVG